MSIDGPKIGISVGTKLLASLVLILVVALAGLDFATIVVLEKDKRENTYKSQATESLLAGREFTHRVQSGVDTLRVALANLDPGRPVQPSDVDGARNLLKNQRELAALSFRLVGGPGGTADGPGAPAVREVLTVDRPEILAQGGIAVDELSVVPELWKESWDGLVSTGTALINASVLGKGLVVAIVVADLNFRADPRGMPVAVGYLSLVNWGRELATSGISIATKEGWLLFDSTPTRVYSKLNILDDPLFSIAVSSPIAGGAQEFEAEGRRYLGSFYRPGFDLVVLSRTDWTRAMSGTLTLVEKLVLLGFMVIGSGVIFAILFSKSISSPIQSLYEATREVAAGNFNLNLNARSSDELGALTQSFNVMSKRIVELIDDSVRKTQLENEVAIASTVQQTLIPDPVYEDERVLIHSHYQSATECGGDWWGFFGVGSRIGVMIADATGHGLPSALITASARSCFSVMHKLALEDPEFSFSPAAMLSFANRVVFDAASGKIMMTFFIATLDFDTMKLTYSSAGHNPPWIFKDSGNGFQLKSLTAMGTRLGENQDESNFEEKSVDLSPGDILFLYTDGLVEGKSLEGEMYGKKRARKVVEAALAGGPRKVIEDTVREFMAHNGEKPLDDDMTLASILIKGGSA